MLNTDLREIGLDPQYSYLIIIDGNDPECHTTSRADTSAFNYTYKGVIYAMRYMYVYPGDDEADPGFSQASSVNLLTSSVENIINNCLNTAISAVISAISAPLGTVSSICGLSIDAFGASSASTLDLYGGTNWSRVYTQVYDIYDQSWMYGSSVEYVIATSKIEGQYYSRTLNKYVSVPDDEESTTTYSSNYNNFTWRKNTAVQRYLAGLPCMKDTTGHVYYKYGGSTKITHYEFF